MRILLTADPGICVPPVGYGGVERIIDSLAREYRARGHSVGLIAQMGSTCQVDSFFPWSSSPEGAGPGALRGMAYLVNAVRSFKPDVLHSFSRLGFMLPLLPNSLPKVMSYQRHTGGRQIAWASWLGRRNLQFTGCSEFISTMGRRSGGNWHTIHNFVDLGKYDFVPHVPEDAPLVFLSRIESIKGPDVAIDLARASGKRLILAGNKPKAGSELEFWNERIAGQIGKNGVEWIGEVNDTQKNKLLGQAAALVVPIQWDEPFGIVFVEALACGTPVITCSRGAAPEIIEEGKTGFFVSGAASGQQAASRLRGIDRKECRLSAERRFGSYSCANQYLELYQGMIP
jgi:glycosyltransferase involved in cell wall biosynthesis